MPNSDNSIQNTQQSLFAAKKKIFPQKVTGTFRKIKTALMFAAFAVTLLLPFLRWDRIGNAPDQAVLIDLPGRRLYFFFIEIWPQEVYYLTGLLLIAALLLFLMSSVAGRVWCGYLCWQTVWTDMFVKIARFIQKDRRKAERRKADMAVEKNRRKGERRRAYPEIRGERDQILLHHSSWSLRKIWLVGLTHVIWLAISFTTAVGLTLYFGDAFEMVADIFTLNASASVYMWIAIFTGTTYIAAGFTRDDICVYMCPYSRFQGALTDDTALNVTYRSDRGEPRGSMKERERLLAAGEPAGDCISCNQCIWVCPTGIDIRNGAQIECIQCALCIDACDNVMKKVGLPTGLIAYDTDVNIALRKQGKPPLPARIFRPRTIIYMVLIAAIIVLMSLSYGNRTVSSINVLHDRNPMFVRLSDGGVRNGYTVRLLNKELKPRVYEISVSGIDGMTMKVAGLKPDTAGKYTVQVEGNSTLELRILLFSPPGITLPKATPVIFHIMVEDTGDTDEVGDFFNTSGE
jgi:cytochrome c oxidase accessory protein FixG